MALNEDFSGLEPKQDQLIYSLLREKTKAEAARKSGVPLRTMYNWLADPKFMAAYRAARHGQFDDALAVLERGAAKAAQVLVDELDPETYSFIDRSPILVNAAKSLLDRAFKAQDAIAVEEELADLREVIAALKAGSPPAPVAAENHREVWMAKENEQAEAAVLRVAWMAEIGMDPHDIEASLRHNRPQSAVEERNLLDLVRKMLEMERLYSQVVA